MRPALLMRSYQQVVAGYASLTDSVTIDSGAKDNNTTKMTPPGVTASEIITLCRKWLTDLSLSCPADETLALL